MARTPLSPLKRLTAVAAMSLAAASVPAIAAGPAFAATTTAGLQPCGLVTNTAMSSAIGSTITSTTKAGKDLAGGLTCTYWVHNKVSTAGFGSVYVSRPKSYSATMFKLFYLSAAQQKVNGYRPVSGLGQVAAWRPAASTIYVFSKNTLLIIGVNKMKAGTAVKVAQANLVTLAKDALAKVG